MEIIIATHNVHKIREFRDMFKKLKGIEVLSLLNFPDCDMPEETGETFQENALLKAKHVALKLNKWALADDSGLVIPALQGRPGVRSRRYAGDHATDAENRKKVLQEMQGFSDLHRTAYFECCLALCSPEGIEKCVTGVCEGYIVREERGCNGFGYDSIFVKNDYDKTFAELSESIKNRISHRHKAFDKLTVSLESL